jgi:hypothetical protein
MKKMRQNELGTLVIAVMLFGGCGHELDTQSVSRAQADLGGPGLRSALTLEVSRLVVGGASTYTVRGLVEGELVHIGRTSGGDGEGPCLGTLGGLCLDLSSPVALHASGIADEMGTAVIELELPPTVPVGKALAFQAVVPRGESGFAWLKTDVVHAVTETAVPDAEALNPGDVVISELMVQPTSPEGEYIELYNATDLAIDLSGLEVVAAAVYRIGPSTLLEPGGFVVLGESTDLARNGGVEVDRQWPGPVGLADSWGEVVLRNGAGVIDVVAWDDGTAWPLAPGVALSVEGELDADGNDSPGAWCSEGAALPEGDLGSPHHSESCGIRASDVAVGYHVACALEPSGELLCWGDEAESDDLDVPGGLFQAVDAGFGACAIDLAGYPACWGGELYLGEELGAHDTPAVPLQAISTGDTYGCGIELDGGLICWGDDDDGMVSDAPAGTFLALDTLSDGYACAIDTGGSLHCWGEVLWWVEPSPVDPPEGSFVEVDTGIYTACAIRTTGEIQCWGADEDIVSEAPAGAFADVDVVGSYACATDTEGWVECWGWLGSWDMPPAVRMTSIDGKDGEMCGIDTLGSLHCWGDDWSLVAAHP